MADCCYQFFVVRLRKQDFFASFLKGCQDQHRAFCFVYALAQILLKHLQVTCFLMLFIFNMFLLLFDTLFTLLSAAVQSCRGAIEIQLID